MIIKSESNEKTFIEFRERMTIGERERYIRKNQSRLKTNDKGEFIYAPEEFEESADMFILQKLIIKIVQDGEDITPAENTLSAFITVMDNKFNDYALLEKVMSELMKINGFLKDTVEEPKKTTE